MPVTTNAESSLFNLSSARDGLRLILETALDAVVVMRADGVVADWNDRAADVFGWSRDEAVGRTMAGPVAELVGIEGGVVSGVFKPRII
jgi:PAS domain-containing protein